jgi:hypothetical protein
MGFLGYAIALYIYIKQIIHNIESHLPLFCTTLYKVAHFQIFEKACYFVNWVAMIRLTSRRQRLF